MDNIKESLEAVRNEIEIYARNLINKGKNAFDESRFEDASKLSDQGKKLQDFSKKVDSLAIDWNRNFNNVIEQHFPRKITSSPKSPQTGLSVTFPDGNYICEKKAAFTFIFTLDKIGFNKIEDLNVTVRTLPLVSKQKINHPTYQEHFYNGYWVVTHSSTAEKKEILENISKSLGLDINIKII
jgi:hypothetical protein